MISISKKCICRGEGKAYLSLVVAGYRGSLQLCVLSPDGDVIPSEFHLLPHSGESAEPFDEYLAIIPLLQCSSFNFEIVDETGDGARLKITASELKWKSRVNYRLHSEECMRLKDMEAEFEGLSPQIYVYECFDCESDVVWRGEIVHAEKGALTLSVLDSQGLPINAQSLIENTEPADNSRGFAPQRNRTLFSLVLESTIRNFCITATFGQGESRGFYCVDQIMFQRFSERYIACVENAGGNAGYQHWFDSHCANIGSLESQKNFHFAIQPLISIVVPCYRTPEQFFVEMVDSVLNQSYRNWELIIIDASPDDPTIRNHIANYSDNRIKPIELRENTSIVSNTNAGIRATQGDYIAFLDHDDIIEPDTLFRYVEAINNYDAALIYCDEDHFKHQGNYFSPTFKPDFNRDLLYAHNYITHFLAISRPLIESINLSEETVNGAQDYDLVLKCIEQTNSIVHVPRVLYHWREHPGSTSGDLSNKDYANVAGQVALTEHMNRRGIDAVAELTDHPCVYHLKYSLPKPHPKVSIVIPLENHSELITNCVDSILKKSTYDAYEIIVVRNSENAEATAIDSFLDLAADERVNIAESNEALDSPHLINKGVSSCSGDFVLLLNESTSLISDGFIEEMLGFFMRPEVGVVGAKLLFNNNLTRHAGIVVGPHGTITHVNVNLSRNQLGYCSRAVVPSNFTAVSSACQMIRKSLFNELHGFDEDFTTEFGAIDFCLRAQQAGFLVVFSPQAMLYQFGSTTCMHGEKDRQTVIRWEKERGRFMEKWSEYSALSDPCSNSNLNPNSAYFNL